MNVPVRSQAIYDELDELQAAIAEGDKEESDFAVADALDDDGTKTAAAAIKVQAVVRRQRARSEIAKKRSAVVRLQAVTRGKARRKSHLTKVGAATSMQALLRGKARRTSHLKKVGAVTSMQAVFRGQSTRGIESAAPYEPFMQGAVSHLIASGANRSESGGSSDYDYDDTSSAAGGQQSGAKQDEFGDDFFLNADPAEDDTAGDAGGANGGSRCHPVRLSPHSPRSRRVQDDTEKGTPGDDSLADLIAQMERELSGIGVGGGNYAMDSDDGDDDDDYGNDYSDENKPGGQQQQSEGAMIGRVLAGGEEFEGEEEGDSTDLEAAAVKLQAVARGKARRVSHLGKETAVIKLQAVVRGNARRTLRLEQEASAIRLQSIIRGRRDREDEKRRRKERKDELVQQQQYTAITRIQSRIRGNSVRRVHRNQTSTALRGDENGDANEDEDGDSSSVYSSDYDDDGDSDGEDDEEGYNMYGYDDDAEFDIPSGDDRSAEEEEMAAAVEKLSFIESVYGPNAVRCLDMPTLDRAIALGESAIIRYNFTHSGLPTLVNTAKTVRALRRAAVADDMALLDSAIKVRRRDNVSLCICVAWSCCGCCLHATPVL